MKILVIDDDALVRRTLSRILRADGHEVISADNGRTGMALFRKETPPVVITDIIMPEQEGIETIITMRRENPAVRIMAISGGGSIGTIDVLQIARSFGADDVIEKPFRVDDVLRRVRLLTQHGPSGEVAG